MSNDQAFEIVRRAVVELAEDSGYPQLLAANGSTPLFGGESGIDSLSLVLLIAEIERGAEQAFGVPIVLADDRAMSRRTSPFRTVGTLTELLVERLVDSRD